MTAILALPQKTVQAVTPANPPRRASTGVQKPWVFLDSGFRRNDTKGHLRAFYEAFTLAYFFPLFSSSLSMAA